jgi:hypothetical protein
MDLAFDFDKGDAANVADLLSEIGESLVLRARMRANNRTAEEARTVIRRQISQETGAPAKALARRFKIRRASVKRPDSNLFVGTSPVRAYDLGVRELRKGVSYKAAGGRTKVRSAFVATMKSGHTGVFQRETKKRLPIRELTVPLHPAALRSARAYLAADARRTFEKTFAHDLQFRIGREIDRRGL